MRKITLFIKQKLVACLPDRLFIKRAFKDKQGYPLNLDNPRTFSEKIQWLKLYDRKPVYTTMVDKYAVKRYVAERIGEKYVIPTLGVWSHFDDIDFEKLPSQFVLKCTHDSGGLVICKDKDSLNLQEAKDKINKSLKRDYYKIAREWPYKNVPRQIIAEKYIEPAANVSDLTDYKWYCFGGEPKYCQVIQNRHIKETIDFFDTAWNHQEFVGLNPAVGPATVTPARPNQLDTQIKIAKILSKDIPFSRIDLYESGSEIYFGEITFYPASGYGKFTPEKYNELLGDMITLPL